MRTWGELFPDGRDIFYEGNDPEGFVRQIKAEFGFDPSEDPRWGLEHYEDGEPVHRVNMYQFRCPGEHMDAIYGSDRWITGS